MISTKQNYSDLIKGQDGPDKGTLFNRLKSAVENHEDIKDILKSSGIQDVLNTRIEVNHDDGTKSIYTFLTYAIMDGVDNIEAAKNILDTANRNTLNTLLKRESIIQYERDTEELSALSFAEKKKKHFENQREQLMQQRQPWNEGSELLTQQYQSWIKKDEQFIAEYQSLIEEIKGKMQELTAANDLFWAVLKGNNKHADSLLNEHREDIQVILQSDWVATLLIGYEKARALAAADNTTIIKEIQTRQAVGIGIVGGLLLAGAIAAFVFAPIIIGIIAAVAGLAVAGFAARHGFKAVPDTKMDEVDNAEHTAEQTVLLL